jgi:protein TonB
LVTTIKLRRRGLKGKVYVTFVVEKDGSLTDIKVIYWLRYWKEAIRVLKNVRNGHLESKMVKKLEFCIRFQLLYQSAE